jgi:hypothetical protein
MEDYNGMPMDWGLNVHFMDGSLKHEEDETNKMPYSRADDDTDFGSFPSPKKSINCSSDKQCGFDEYCSKYKACLKKTFPQNRLYGDMPIPSDEESFQRRYAEAFIED